MRSFLLQFVLAINEYVKVPAKFNAHHCIVTCGLPFAGKQLLSVSHLWFVPI